MKQRHNELQLSKPLVYVDTEWTDLNPEERRIVSIAIARFDTDGTRKDGYWLVNPKRRISEQSSAVHGIRQEDVQSQPEFRRIAGSVEELLEDADIAGYGVTNDIEIIEKEMRRAGRDWTGAGRRIIDAHRLWQVREPRTLSDAHRRFVGPLPEDLQAHDARHDVEMTIAVINAMQDGKTLEELHQEAHPGMVDPAGKFRREGSEILFNFGPYRGLPVSEYPEYLDWMLSRSFAPSTMDQVRALLAEFWLDEDDDEQSDEYEAYEDD